MKILILAILLLILPIVGFSQMEKPTPTPGPPKPAVRNSQKVSPKAINITIEGQQIIIGETKFSLPVERDELIKLFGIPSLKSPLANNIYTWDDYGIYGYEKPGETLIFALVFQLSREDGIFNFTPLFAFSGKLLIDNAVVTADSTINQINESKTGKPFSEVKLLPSIVNIKYDNLEIGLTSIKRRKDNKPFKLLRLNLDSGQR
jgi:hypothetical protein